MFTPLQDNGSDWYQGFTQSSKSSQIKLPIKVSRTVRQRKKTFPVFLLLETVAGVIVGVCITRRRAIRNPSWQIFSVTVKSLHPTLAPLLIPTNPWKLHQYTRIRVKRSALFVTQWTLVPLFLFTRHLDGAKRLVSPVKSPAFIAVSLRWRKFKPITSKRWRQYDGMVNANGNRCAGTCRNHLPVAREDAV